MPYACQAQVRVLVMALDGQVYQFKYFVRGISPMIWRRVLLQSNSSLADLHEVIQLSMGWESEHLYAFRLHGKNFGTLGGVGDQDEPLSVLKLRLNERFLYEYNFQSMFDVWQIEIRMEKSLPLDGKLLYPHCLAGNRSGPPEELTVQEYLSDEYQITARPLAELAQALLDKNLDKVRRILDDGKIYSRNFLNRLLAKAFTEKGGTHEDTRRSNEV
jgi:hypothetical protein